MIITVMNRKIVVNEKKGININHCRNIIKRFLKSVFFI